MPRDAQIVEAECGKGRQENDEERRECGSREPDRVPSPQPMPEKRPHDKGAQDGALVWAAVGEDRHAESHHHAGERPRRPEESAERTENQCPSAERDGGPPVTLAPFDDHRVECASSRAPASAQRGGSHANSIQHTAAAGESRTDPDADDRVAAQLLARTRARVPGRRDTLTRRWGAGSRGRSRSVPSGDEWDCSAGHARTYRPRAGS